MGDDCKICLYCINIFCQNIVKIPTPQAAPWKFLPTNHYMTASTTKPDRQTGTNLNVINRDGSRSPLDITKIRDAVEWACQGLNVTAIALESGLTTRLRDGISTRDIQENLISCALEMCSPEEPDWRYVAGRLHIWSHRKEMRVSRQRGGYYDKLVFSDASKSHFGRYCYWRVNEGDYDDRILAYSLEELYEAGKWIDPNLDLDYDYAGAVLLTSRYLLPNELPQEAFLVCALLLVLPEEPGNRLYWAKRFYLAIAKRKISLATPILANLRVPGGSLSSCFIVAMNDDLESIFAEITNTARISKNGGGVGVCMSRIRATGSDVMGRGNASGGVIPWVKLLNDTAIAVNQGGKRSGAVTVGLDIWHLDIPEFLEIQAENGDQRRKAYDIFPQLVISDEFMRRVVKGEAWTLFCPHEVETVLGVDLPSLWGESFELVYPDLELAAKEGRLKLTKTVNTKELFKDIMRIQLESGLPYLCFKDTINRANPNKHVGYIPQTNLCCESYSNVEPGVMAHCCNLDSLNLANLDISELSEYAPIAVRILDNTIEITTPPLGEAKAHNDLYRTIGVGAMGLADYLAKRETNYSNINLIDELFEEMSYHCVLASHELAKERGAFPAFPGSDWQNGNIQNILPGLCVQGAKWQGLIEAIEAHGVRNSHIMAIAPNTSSSLVQGCTASILPAYSRFFYDKWAKGTVPIAPPYIGEKWWHYQENKTIDQKTVIKATAVIQQWIDTGISMELLFNLNAGVYYPDEPERSVNAKDIFDTLVLAWEQKCKAIYYIRSVQKDDFKEGSEGCTSCAN